MELISRKDAKLQGLLRYFTGTACSFGHISERWVQSTGCIKCGKIRQTNWKKQNPDKVSESRAKYHQRLRAECFAIIGNGRCSCCGENELVFLCIDHKNGGGNAHRRSIGIKQGTGGAVFSRWLLREADRIGRAAIRKQFRILCHNCNLAFHILGYCPHHPRRK